MHIGKQKYWVHFNVLYKRFFILSRLWLLTFASLFFWFLCPALSAAENETGMPQQAAPTLSTPQPPITNVPSSIPTFAELEAAGAVIGKIYINNQDIFDLDNPKEDGLVYRLANKLHNTTRPGVIRQSLLFNTGETVSVQLIDETERVLRRNRFLYNINITPVAYHDGVVDVEVKTRDTWSLEFGATIGRAGGVNSTSVTFVEKNLFGTGTAIGYSGVSDADRTGTEAVISKNHLFGNWEKIEYKHAQYNDGKRDQFNLEKPFYALDTRWAAGIKADVNKRVDAEYNSGVIVGQYQHQSMAQELYGGLSKGLVDGWARRYSAGVQYQKDDYALDPLLPTPTLLPTNQKIVAPFLRYEIVEDGFEKVTNRDLINRAEFFNMGLTANFQLGRSMFNSTNAYWIYSSTVSDGWHLSERQSVLLSAHLSGRNGDEAGDVRMTGGTAKYYRKQSTHGLFFAEITADTVHEGTAAEQLLLGGDTGLRGYPLRYQTGINRTLFSMEQRGYSDLYLFRIFRVGGAVFYDAGRAWGGTNQNINNPGWLHNVGLGLRMFNDRTASGNVIHVDLAVPLNRTDDIKSVQFLIKGRDSF